jgi:hypothetical protein
MVSADRVREFVEFLRDMGVLIWYDEPGLREIIILDPVTYFVKPVIRVICQLDLHISDVHQRCRKRRPEEFENLFAWTQLPLIF